MSATRNSAQVNAAVSAAMQSQMEAFFESMQQSMETRLERLENAHTARVAQGASSNDTSTFDSRLVEILENQQRDNARRRDERLDKAPEIQKGLKFRGTQKELRMFLQDVENAHAMQTSVENRDKHLPMFIPALRQYFQEAAADWFRNWTESTRSNRGTLSWANLKAALSTAYADEFQYVTLWKEARDLRIGHGDFAQYFQRFKAIVTQLVPPLSALTKHVLFIQGLPKLIVNDLETLGFKTVEEMEQMGLSSYRRWDREDNRGAERKVEFERRNSRGRDRSAMSGQQEPRDRSPSNDSSKSDRRSRSPRRNPLSDDQRTALFTWMGKRCGKCGQDGHMQRDCKIVDNAAWRKEKSEYIRLNILNKQ